MVQNKPDLRFAVGCLELNVLLWMCLVGSDALGRIQEKNRVCFIAWLRLIFLKTVFNRNNLCAAMRGSSENAKSMYLQQPGSKVFKNR